MFLVDDCCFPCRGPKYAELLADTEHDRLEFVAPNRCGVTMISVLDKGTTRQSVVLSTHESYAQIEPTSPTSSVQQQWHFNNANGVLSHTVNPPPEVNIPAVNKSMYFRDDYLITEQNYPSQSITVKRTWRRSAFNFN